MEAKFQKKQRSNPTYIKTKQFISNTSQSNPGVLGFWGTILSSFDKGDGNDTPLGNESYVNGSVFGREGTAQSKKRPYDQITHDPETMIVDKDNTKKQMKMTKVTQSPKKKT